jgi:predicted nuclease of predicted toxin-antitoxin system
MIAGLLALLRIVEPSVILFRVESINTSRMNDWLTGILVRHADDLKRGAIIVVEDDRERIRLLPIWRSEKHDKQ